MANTNSTPTATSTLELTRASIELAHERIKPYIHQTPLTTCKTLDRIASSPNPKAYLSDTPPTSTSTPNRPGTTETPAPRLRIHLKLESQQRTGSFKARGAFHALTYLASTLPGGLPSLAERGVATQSSGNHAAALACAARAVGAANGNVTVPAYIVMPRVTSANKVAATLGYGGEVVFCEGHTVRDREEGLKEVVQRTGAEVVPPYDDERIILGQGTVGRELEGQFRDGWAARGQEKEELDAVLAPVSGGGLLGGIATWFADKPGTRVFGAEPSYQGANDAERGLALGKRVEAVNSLTIAEGCRGVVGHRNWGIISDRSKVEGVYSVDEEEIRMAMRLLFERAKVVVEPSGAVALAVVLFNQAWRQWVVEQQKSGETWDVAVVLSGGNTTMEAIAKLYGT